jgi:hypothetical protein
MSPGSSRGSLNRSAILGCAYAHSNYHSYVHFMRGHCVNRCDLHNAGSLELRFVPLPTSWAERN